VRIVTEIDAASAKPSKARSRLSFRPIGEPIQIDEVTEAYRQMAKEYGKPVTPDAMARIGGKSGSHLLKLISPRADGDQSVMRHIPKSANRRANLVPSVNAADIPIAKIAFHPIEVIGYTTQCLVDHILNPDDISDRVMESFGAVFGADVLDALKSSLAAEPAPITRLPAAEFPIVFLPTPAGGDLQATPLAPAAAYMAIRQVTAPYYRRQEKEGPKVPRGSWSRQLVSAKPQNISGAIGGSRIRFHARFPGTLDRFGAEIRRFVAGGGFPRMLGAEIADGVLRYADLLERDAKYSNRDIRSGLDRRADRLIREALEFIEDIRAEATLVESSAMDLPVPRPDVILLRCRWPRRDDFDRARQALTGAHFRSRVETLRPQE
jgi:hypothetical protein